MKIESFTVNHDLLNPGIYVSRKDYVDNSAITTFDIRMKKPNIEPVLDNPAIHTLEHLVATYLRCENHEYSKNVIYFGPMGCRTGMYLILGKDLVSKDIVNLVKDMFQFVIDFDGELPGNTSIECGNYLDHNMAIAKWEAKKYMEILNNIKTENLIYPEGVWWKIKDSDIQPLTQN